MFKATKEELMYGPSSLLDQLPFAPPVIELPKKEASLRPLVVTTALAILAGTIIENAPVTRRGFLGLDK